jgi:hypothetical protein
MIKMFIAMSVIILSLFAYNMYSSMRVENQLLRSKVAELDYNFKLCKFLLKKGGSYED